MVSRVPMPLGRRVGPKASKLGNWFSFSVVLTVIIGLSVIWWTLTYTATANSHIHPEKQKLPETWRRTQDLRNDVSGQIQELPVLGNSGSDAITVTNEEHGAEKIDNNASKLEAEHALAEHVAQSTQQSNTSTAVPQTPGLPESLASIKAERPDARCEALSKTATGSAAQDAAKALFDCRMQVANSLVDAACSSMDAESNSGKHNLNIGAYLLGMGLPVPPEKYNMMVPIALQQDADIISNSVRSSGVWSVAEVRTVIRGLYAANSSDTAIASEPPVLMDIGANLGVFTMVAASLGFRVYAFEALSTNVERLHQTLCWNPHLRDLVTVIPIGLSDREQDCLMISDNIINNGDGHSVCTDEQLNEYRPKEGDSGNYVSHGAVHTVRLADYFAGGPRIDVVKLDVEGYEPHVLSGAGDVLDNVRYLLTEINPSDIGKKTSNGFEATAMDYLLHWESRGFELHMCSDTSCFETIATTPENIVDYCTASDGALVDVLMISPSQQNVRA